MVAVLGEAATAWVSWGTYVQRLAELEDHFLVHGIQRLGAVELDDTHRALAQELHEAVHVLLERCLGGSGAARRRGHVVRNVINTGSSAARRAECGHRTARNETR